MTTNYKYNEQSIVGKTIESVKNVNNEELLFRFTDGSNCKFYHYQDCCESVYIEESDDLTILVGATLTAVTKQEESKEEDYDSITITTYLFTHNLGGTKVIWKGVSNGYYSEGVDFEFYPNED